MGGTLDELWPKIAGPRIGELSWFDVSADITGTPEPGTTMATMELLRWPEGRIIDLEIVDNDFGDGFECEPIVQIEGALSLVSDDGVLDEFWNVELMLIGDRIGFTAYRSTKVFANFRVDFRVAGDPNFSTTTSLDTSLSVGELGEMRLAYSVAESHRNRRRGPKSYIGGSIFEWRESEDPESEGPARE